MSITNLTNYRIDKKSIVYTVEFCHDHRGLSFTVYDIQDSEHDRLSLAADFEACAESLRSGTKENSQ